MMGGRNARLLIIGAGGHGKVAADCALCLDRWQEVAFIDDNVPQGTHVLGLPVIGGLKDMQVVLRDDPESSLFVAIGDAGTRREVFDRLIGFEESLVSLIHPSATIARSVTLGRGVIVCAGAVVNAATEIGMLSIVNTSASVDHDCHIGELAHICPGAHIGGGVRVGKMSWIGIGASVKHGLTIGEGVTVGAGAAVIRDVPDSRRVAGVPAREIGQKK